MRVGAGGGDGRIMKVVSERLCSMLYVNDNGGDRAKTGGMYLHWVFSSAVSSPGYLQTI